MWLPIKELGWAISKGHGMGLALVETQRKRVYLSTIHNGVGCPLFSYDLGGSKHEGISEE